MERERLPVNYQIITEKYGRFEKEQSVDTECSFSLLEHRFTFFDKNLSLKGLTDTP